jgi:hypothetical protein
MTLARLAIGTAVLGPDEPSEDRPWISTAASPVDGHAGLGAGPGRVAEAGRDRLTVKAGGVSVSARARPATAARTIRTPTPTRRRHGNRRRGRVAKCRLLDFDRDRVPITY